MVETEFKRRLVTVEFTLPSGGTRPQRVKTERDDMIGHMVARAANLSRERGAQIANVLSVKRGKVLLFSFEDTATRFRR